MLKGGIYIFFYSVGGVLVAIAAVMFIKAQYLKRNGVLVTAKVADIMESYDYEQGGSSYYPVLQYQVDGVAYEKKHAIPSYFGRFEEGQSIPIYCSRKNPKRYVIPGKRDALYVLFLGIVCIVMAVGRALSGR